MKTEVEDIVEWIEERHENQYMDELTPEELTSEVLRALVELELPELEEELARFEGQKFTTLGKIELMEELRSEAQT